MLFQLLRVMLNHFKVIKGGRIPSPVESLYRKKRCQFVIVLPAPPSSLSSPLSPFSFPPFILLPFITPGLQTCLLRMGGWEGSCGDWILFRRHCRCWTTPEFFLCHRHWGSNQDDWPRPRQQEGPMKEPFICWRPTDWLTDWLSECLTYWRLVGVSLTDWLTYW